MELIYKEKLVEAAHAGGAVLRKYFGQTLNPKEKTSPSDVQTEADVESEKAILAVIKDKFPDYSIVSEETGKIDKKSEYTFYIDPLDGTNNFVMGVPNFSVSIGLVKNNKIIAGVVYQPILDQIFYAESDKGAYLNDNTIKVNNVSDHSKCTIATVFTYATDKKEANGIRSTLGLSGAKRILAHWSVANDLCLLASGKIESLISFGCDIHDYAAGKLIAKEAGAKSLNLHGQEEENELSSQFIIGGNQEENKRILEILKPLEK
jgi:myo-inositol-1(or 4)-monophosphatase